MSSERSSVGFSPHQEYLDAMFCQTCLSQVGGEPEWVQEPEIMIAAEEFAFSQALGAILKDQGCQIYLAPDVDTAIEELKNYGVDLLIIQVSRGNRAGMEAIYQAKKVAGAKVVVISGPHGKDFPVEAFDQDVDDYLVFPFTTAELRRRVASLLGSGSALPKNYADQSSAGKINDRALQSLQLLMAEIRNSLVRASASLNFILDRGAEGDIIEEVMREIFCVISLADNFQRNTSYLSQFRD